MREKLLHWITGIYKDRRIKRSGEPYLNHLIAVADMVSTLLPFGYETGLLHDLLEDTGMPEQKLQTTLESLGYAQDEGAYITRTVTELTDVYTKTDYPLLTKKQRKQKEEERLTTISAEAQTVKYADLIYNVQWMVKYQPAKAPAYLKRKLALLRRLDKGDPGLRSRAIAMFYLIRFS